MKKLKVSIGVPALNEEKNIVLLLSTLLTQKRTNFELTEIIVITDGSTDATPELVKSIKNKKIKLIVGEKRRGQQERQNQIIEMYEGDILVLLEADILPATQLTIAELVKPFTMPNAETIGMVVGNARTVQARGFFEKIMTEGHIFKQKMFAEWKNGLNVYTAGGHAMKALSRTFTGQLHYPVNVPEDAYTYLALKNTHLRMVRRAKAVTYMRNVTHFTDRIRQCTKFQSGKKSLGRYFSKKLLHEAYDVPITILITNCLKEFFREPFWFSLYILEACINRMFSKHIQRFNALHTTYQSSKNLLITPIGIHKRKHSVTIGIPAFNEEKNIGLLLKNILRQNQTSWKLDQIIVCSDGSTDRTNSIVQSFHEKLIKLIINPVRSGQSLSQNKIIKNTKSDILVVLNADILPTDKNFITNIIHPIQFNNNVGLVSSKITAIPADNLFGEIIRFSHECKQLLFEKMEKRNPIYLCNGRARAFSKAFYKSLVFPKVISEDAFSYLQAKRMGFSFAYQPLASISFAPCLTFDDHYLQSSRFFNSQEELNQLFDHITVKNEYHIPRTKSIPVIIISVLKNPLKSILYAGIVLAVLIKKELSGVKDMYLWKPSASSKKLRIAKIKIR